MLPNKELPGWEMLVTGKKIYNLRNFVLQMKVTQTAKDIKADKITVQKAIDDIYALCAKYEKAVKMDMQTIFSDEPQNEEICQDSYSL